MAPRCRAGRLLAAAALGIVLLGGPPPMGGGDWLGAREAAAQEVASVEGFRSARFGMTEKQVRKALMKDFGVGEDGNRRRLERDREDDEPGHQCRGHHSR